MDTPQTAQTMKMISFLSITRLTYYFCATLLLSLASREVFGASCPASRLKPIRIRPTRIAFLTHRIRYHSRWVHNTKLSRRGRWSCLCSSRGFDSKESYNEYPSEDSEVSKFFAGDVGGVLVPLSLAGRCSHASDKGSAVEILLLSTLQECNLINNAYTNHSAGPRVNTIPVPLSPTISSSALRLLSHTYASLPLSKPSILSLNSVLINRDGGLFDNLPWATWSIDPDGKSRDAANNIFDEKFSLGKRVAYQRFMGKDWRGRSLSMVKLAGQARQFLEESGSRDRDAQSDDTLESIGEEDMMTSLSKRLLELEINEARMEVAECEQRLAVHRTESAPDESTEYSDFTEWSMETLELTHQQLDRAQSRLNSAESSLRDIRDDDKKGSSKSTLSTLMSILDKMDKPTDSAPHRGAIGYPPKSDSIEDLSQTTLPKYNSPYDLMIEIIDEQLNAEIIGCVLEPTSIFESNLVLGGAILLRRKGRRITATVAGERVQYTDDEDDFGNEGVLPRSVYVVECLTDEAIGMALGSGRPVYLERRIWERAGNVPVVLDDLSMIKNTGDFSAIQRLPILRPLNELIVASEGDKVSSDKDANSIRIPLTTTPQFFGAIQQSSQSRQLPRDSPVFSTYEPVGSLNAYDLLTDNDKARILLKLESFQGSLPRPRVIEASKSVQKSYTGNPPPSALDNLLIPLIDETIRRRYLIRDAERRNDSEMANVLRSKVSPRQEALEKAMIARENGMEEEAMRLEEEAELYKAVRADVTQDEGTYNRFLDRDLWYEKETQARIKRMDKSKFGSLLDGIDLP